MTAFADASALVKLYADEDGHEAVRVEAHLVVAAVSRVEVASALWRKARSGELSDEDAGLLLGAFEADWYGDGTAPSRFSVVSQDDALLDRAAHLCGVHGLRAYDAVQLSTALAVRDLDPPTRRLLAFDRLLRRAASREGLDVGP